MSQYDELRTLRPLEHFQTDQGPYKSICNDFEKNQLFIFEKKNLRHFLTVLAYFDGSDKFEAPKIDFFKK